MSIGKSMLSGASRYSASRELAVSLAARRLLSKIFLSVVMVSACRAVTGEGSLNSFSLLCILNNLWSTGEDCYGNKRSQMNNAEF